MPDFDIRDAHLEIERLAQDAGVMPSAVRELINLHAPYFKRIGDDLIHRETMQTIEEFVASLKTEKPHYFVSDTLDDLQERAFGANPTLKARGELFNDVGPTLYRDIAKMWGASEGNLKPGTRPGPDVEAEKNPEIVVKRNNPWSKQGWNITKQGALVASLGIEKSAAIARSVGCKIGDTKWNPKFN